MNKSTSKETAREIVNLVTTKWKPWLTNLKIVSINYCLTLTKLTIRYTCAEGYSKSRSLSSFYRLRSASKRLKRLELNPSCMRYQWRDNRFTRVWKLNLLGDIPLKRLLASCLISLKRCPERNAKKDKTINMNHLCLNQ